MDVKLTKKPVPTITVSGEIDHYNANRVAPAIREAAQIAPSMIIDLTDVSYLDSAGIQLIFLASRLTGESGMGRTIIVVKNNNIRRILEITGVGSIPNLELVNDVRTAVKHIGAK